MRAAGFEYADIVSADTPEGLSLLGVIDGGSPWLSGLHWFDTSAPATIREGLRKAKAGGLHALTLGVGPRQQESMQYLVQTLELVLADMPNDISIELANRSGTRLEQLEDFRELFVLIQHPRLAVAVDAVEFHRASVNPTAAIREQADRMTRLIVGDLIGGQRVPLGDGEVNIPAVIEHARRVGYNGWIVLDPYVADVNAADEDLAREHE